MDRRDFLKAASVAGAAGALGSCTAFDRVLMGQTGDNSDRVVILGAGMAGLRAAYELRKKGIPYRVFEGAERIGGRARTLEGLTAADQSAELGCEWFSNDQTVFWELAKELKLEIVEVKNQREKLFIDAGGELNQIPYRDLTQMRDIARKAEGLSSDRSALAKSLESWRDRHLAQKTVSAREWAAQFSDDAAWTELVDAWSYFHYGIGAGEVRSSVFARGFLFAENVLDPWGGSRFKFRGGSSSLAAALGDRVMGVIPNDRLVTGHKLLRVEKLARGGYELHFETPEGKKRYKAKHVVCALPWATLAKIEGFEDFTGANLLKQTALSHQAKIILVARERFWRKRWDQGRLMSATPIWESSYRIQDLIENSSGVLSQVVSGAKASTPDASLSDAFLKRLQVLEKLPSLPVADVQVHSFSVSPWAMARGSYPSLAGAERVFEAPSEENWTWAGEHAAPADMNGTWAGALESGLRAVRPFLEAGKL